MALTIDVLNIKGDKAGSLDLPEGVFNAKVSPALVHEVVTALQANERRGTHSTKTRGEVSGGGLKPWKQKHTGRARSGSNRSPLWRHGGITFGPKPRSYFQGLPESKRRLALKKVLSDAAKDGRVKVMDAFTVSEPKTKRVAEIAKKLGFGAKTLLVVDQAEASLQRAARNYADLTLCRASDLNSYDVLWANQLVFTKAAVEQISKRLEN